MEHIINRSFLVTTGLVLAIIAVVLTNMTFSTNATTEGMNLMGQNRSWEMDKDSPQGVVEIAAVRNLNSDNFLEEMEVEVKNISHKPIYFMLVYGLLPDSQKASGFSSAFRMNYGDQRLVSIRDTRPNSTDAPINPGESAVLKIEPGMVEGYKRAVKNGDIPLATLNKVRLFFQVINHGDGAGYIANAQVPQH